MLDKLNNKQIEAVEKTEGPLLVVAGAGSGKTRVLTTRITYLIKTKNIDPQNILAITFTNKAAKEMKERIIDMAGPFGVDVWASTFHSMCARILRRHSQKININNNFTIIDDTDQKNLMKSIFKDLNIDTKKYAPNSMVYKISDLKNKAILPDEFEKIKETPYDDVVSKI